MSCSLFHTLFRKGSPSLPRRDFSWFSALLRGALFLCHEMNSAVVLDFWICGRLFLLDKAVAPEIAPTSVLACLIHFPQTGTSLWGYFSWSHFCAGIQRFWVEWEEHEALLLSTPYKFNLLGFACSVEERRKEVCLFLSHWMLFF